VRSPQIGIGVVIRTSSINLVRQTFHQNI